MKRTGVSIFCFAMLLLEAPLLRGQELSSYRGFSMGEKLAAVLKHTDQGLGDVKVLHQQPVLLQELTWWPPTIPGMTHQSDTVEQILFSFRDGDLYKMSVIYDRTSTEGLTAGDLVKSISTKYGPATSVTVEIVPAAGGQDDASHKPVASWEDSEYSFNLVRSYFSGGFELIIYSKRAKAEAELAFAEAVKLEQQEAPLREVERQKKVADDLEAARQKNRKAFQP